MRINEIMHEREKLTEIQLILNETERKFLDYWFNLGHKYFYSMLRRIMRTSGINTGRVDSFYYSSINARFKLYGTILAIHTSTLNRDSPKVITLYYPDEINIIPFDDIIGKFIVFFKFYLTVLMLASRKRNVTKIARLEEFNSKLFHFDDHNRFYSVIYGDRYPTADDKYKVIYMVAGGILSFSETSYFVTDNNQTSVTDILPLKIPIKVEGGQI
jgi:hypothetical protein